MTEGLTRGGTLARSAVWTFLGQAAPLVVAVVAIPPIVRGMGTDRFGVLMLAWVVIGYFSLFDLGLGRALTQRLAEQLGKTRNDNIPAMVWTSLIAIFALGAVGALLLAVATPWLVERALPIPDALRGETKGAFLLLAAAVPVVVTTAGLAGILAAYQRFRAINSIRIPMSLLSFLGPLLILPFSNHIAHVVAVLVTGRVIGCLAHAAVCARSVPAMRQRFSLDRAEVLRLLRFGGWMTISNVIGPLMVYLDRLLVGARISMSAVTYYATPSEIATKLWLVPGPLVTVLFPAFATSFSEDPSRTRLLFYRGVKYVLLGLFPVVLVIVSFSRESLTLWLGPEFARNSTTVLQLLSVGVFVNSLAQMPYALVQGLGKPKRTAILHLVELPLYLAALWWLLQSWGIVGAAWAWVARVTVDALCLFLMAERLLGDASGMIRRVALPAFAAGAAFAAAALLQEASPWVRVPSLGAMLLGYGVLAWSRGLKEEKRFIGQSLPARRRERAVPEPGD